MFPVECCWASARSSPGKPLSPDYQRLFPYTRHPQRFVCSSKEHYATVSMYGVQNHKSRHGAPGCCSFHRIRIPRLVASAPKLFFSAINIVKIYLYRGLCDDARIGFCFQPLRKVSTACFITHPGCRDDPPRTCNSKRGVEPSTGAANDLQNQPSDPESDVVEI